MNILSKVTRKVLMKNKVRTAVTVMGIILSAAMITAVTTSISSFFGYMQDVAVSINGLWHGALFGLSSEDLQSLKSDSRVSSAATAQVVGWAEPAEGTDPIMYDQQYLYVLAGDSAFYERMPIELTAGRMPENSSEIVIWASSQYCAVYAGDVPEIGEDLTLSLGERYSGGAALGAFDQYSEGDEVRVSETRTYTVVGYCKEPIFFKRSCPGQMVFTVAGADEGDSFDCYFLMDKPKDTNDFILEFCGGKYIGYLNMDYLQALGVLGESRLMTAMRGMGAILIGLIMFGSVSLIYNAFAISVAERTKQFGLLRSVGATRRQIRAMVLYEAAAVSALGIVLGVAFGILGIGVTFRFIGEDVAKLYYDGSIVRFRLHLTPMSVIAAAAVSFVTVLISAWIPSRRAMRVTAIEAIRQSGDVAVSPREAKPLPLTQKLFGIEGVLAGKYFRRAKKRYRATVVSLFMSVVLFISASSFCRYLTDLTRSQLLDYDYDLSYLAAFQLEERDSDRSALFERMRSVEGVTRASCTREVWSQVIVDREDYIYDSGNPHPEPQQTVTMIFEGVDDETYRDFLREEGLDEQTYMGRDAKLVLNSWSATYNEDTGRLEREKILSDNIASLHAQIMDTDAYFDLKEEVEYVDEDERYHECFSYVDLPVGCQVDGAPFGLYSPRRAMVMAFMPMERFEAIFGRSNEIEFFFAAPDHAAVRKAMEDILDADPGIHGSQYVSDVREGDEMRRSAVTVVNVMSYGFIALISLIAAANVFNTVTTNILLRRREFAMLRSVGMTNGGFYRMMNYECLLYGAKSLAFGIPVALGVTYLIYRTVLSSMDVDFYLPVSAVAIAVGSVFLVVFASMLYSMSGIKRDDPVETIKNEAI